MDNTPEEPNSDANLNKPVSNHIKYRGVRHRNSGKFVAEIRDPKKRARVWLGTFGSGIEAAKAYDKAAFDIHGHKARLNFPLDFGISPLKTEPITVDRKRTRDDHHDDDDIVTVAAVNGDHRLPIHAVKLLAGSGPSSPPSAQGTCRPICQSPPIANFKWTDEWLCAMCDILNKHIAKNGRNCAFDWADHQSELEKISNHKFRTPSALRNKYDAMKGRYYLWKSLMNGETGLRWNESTGKLDCSDDWWEKKIKENAEFKLVRRNQPSRELQEAWDQLFENVVASVADRVDLNNLNQVDHVDLDSVDVSPERTLDSSQLGNHGTEEAEVPSFSKSKNEVRQEDGLVPVQGEGCKPSQKIVKTNAAPNLVKCKTSDSERATMFKEFMTQPNATRQSASKIRKTSNINQVGDFSISASVGVINRMVEEGLMTSCSELWCFAVNLFEDDVKRELFMSLPDDVGRLAWLQYKHNLGN